MSKKPFHKPVVIQPGRIDRDRVVISTRDAAQILLREWPMESEKRVKAMKACLDVIKGNKPPSHARNAFIAAAKDAHILLYPPLNK
ncbi:DUF982 domain-containing protein [Aquamicrobium sp. LC103]|uniref:DUF982 domain-containing protein n=1 Tax=Aquamicrobium sp. LC103 TaxID=1120658 RepID=UPI00063EC604|nr:DUF982 domain-containing protein [Aquamicrobium sp. LC103]TKT74662.1 DUF982 domain-containing protein [Aquamicrobium sp. LC103]